MEAAKERIIRKLMHEPELTFNQLWDKQGPSNKFAYHLKVLEEEKIISKTDKGYSLTHLGKKQSAYIEGETGRKETAPLIGVISVVYHDNKFLMIKRTKEPFYGYWAFHGGKLKFNQYILECAKEEIKEETGFECDVKLKGIFCSKTFSNDNLSYNHQMFIVKATNPQGNLITKTREGENKWFTVEEMQELKKFPNDSKIVEMVLSDGFTWVEADRFQENDEFKEMKILREEKY